MQQQTTKPVASRPATLLMSMLIGSSILLGCANPGEDVRVRLCKDLVVGQLGTSQLTWTQVSTRTPGYSDATVNLRWSAAAGDGSASCAYRYNAVEDTAQQLADPLSAYATSPSQVVINGAALSGQALATAIAQAMQRQGRELIDAASKAIGQ
ncbi:hypothetical protein CKO42_10000 [Lamprobacter modestohalophilus]|uniref:Lipoprotein n=2 Tax=Lamprobacter modestohalophilus TaxID=1064514 RepID=A0A9X0W888_9GAMM|nr:hypothetical protein [Lamprobacter modestohalophilus]